MGPRLFKSAVSRFLTVTTACEAACMNLCFTAAVSSSFAEAECTETPSVNVLQQEGELVLGFHKASYCLQINFFIMRDLTVTFSQ